MQNPFMKRNYLYLAFIAILLFQCTSIPENSIINGKLDNSKYDGEYIYLVPFKNSKKELVDSTIVREGKFSFKGKVRNPEIFVVRTRHKLRFELQDLLIVKEPGEIFINLSHNSSAYGTALNDSLQKWKENKMEFDNQIRITSNKYRATEDTLIKKELRLKLDSIKSESKSYHKTFINNNINNKVGDLVQNLLYPNQTPN